MGNGLNFSSGSPINIAGGQISAQEGASAVSDKNGQLLFYTDGITVWNRNHGTMANGIGLAGGHGSSTQSCLIVPKTLDEKQYYIFTTDQEGGPEGFEYSIVDMTLNGGLGGVTIKNQLLVTPCCEKVTAVRHCNKKDYWVITHQYGSDAYYAYLSTENGVDPTPVISHTGSFIPVAYATAAGQLKASPDGKRIVAASANVGLELSDFNNQTGVISNTTEIFGNANAFHYGVEFSANSKMLYAAIHDYWYQPDFKRYSGLFQFDLSQPTITDIINSKFEVIRYTIVNDASSLERGPDGKIYMTQYQRSYLSVVNAPEIYGAGCNFADTGFVLPTRAVFSLPNLLSDYSSSVDSFQITSPGSCVNTAVFFNYNVANGVDSLQWDFGDAASGPQNSSSNTTPSHTYATAGKYIIHLIKFGPCGNDTLSKQITIGDLQLNLGNDTTICAGSAFKIIPQISSATSLLWQDGSSAPTYTATTTGVYWLQASNSSNGCTRRDSLVITTKPLPFIDLGKDTSLCEGTSLLLNAYNAGAQYLWNDNSTNASFPINTPGTYSVVVTLNGCTAKDSIKVTGITTPQFTLGPDQYLCPGLSLELSPGINDVTYLWQDGNTSPMYNVQQPGLYYVAISNICGTKRDSINIFTGNCSIYIPSAFTPNNDGLNDQFRVSGTGLVSEFDLRIFDRAGQLIFQTRDKNGSWNGELNGIKLPPGIYVYLLKYSEINLVKDKILKGTVLLIR
jgi:gliding motility-associated-like protein